MNQDIKKEFEGPHDTESTWAKLFMKTLGLKVQHAHSDLFILLNSKIQNKIKNKAKL